MELEAPLVVEVAMLTRRKSLVVAVRLSVCACACRVLIKDVGEAEAEASGVVQELHGEMRRL